MSESSSPDIDWYNITPHWLTVFLLDIALYFKFYDSFIFSMFLLSINTTWTHAVFPVILFTVISPVEYILGVFCFGTDTINSEARLLLIRY